jgi:hypothetical protein
MKRTLTLLAIASMLIGGAIYAGNRERAAVDPTTPTDPNVDPPAAGVTPKVDIVIALDTSGSMSGLINAARQKLWDIVNEVAKAKPAPKLRVGLVTFGSRGSEADGFVKIQSNLTGDLDTIYGKLFELSTWGGREYVARAIQRSLKEMSWDTDPQTLRQIYVAGNESAKQDRLLSLTSALAQAKRQDVFVNAIYCGPQTGYDAPSWRSVASGGRGLFAAIDHNHGTIALRSPYDAKLAALSAKLNGTYVAYGRRGRAALRNQAKQDKNAASAHASTGAARAAAKASAVYSNERWDLVDARKKGKLGGIAKDALPAKLRAMNSDELRRHLDAKQKTREALKTKIRELSKKRSAYVQQEMKRQGKTEGKAFNGAVKRALRRQAKTKRLRF